METVHIRDLPQGSMPAADFARICDVGIMTLRNHRNWGLVAKETRQLESIKATPVLIGRTVRHYLTPDQQRRALEFWDRHNVPHRKPEIPMTLSETTK